MAGNPPEEYRFKKGQSGNPGGMPRMKHFRDAIQRIVVQGKEPRPKKGVEMVVYAQYQKALAGDKAATRFIAEYLDGRPLPQQEELDATASAGSTTIIIDSTMRDTDENKD